MKPKPKALKAGSDPMIREAITPAKIRSTASAALSAIRRKRKSPAPARRAVSTRTEREAVSGKLISVKDGPGAIARMGRNSHAAHATNITVLQSFCDDRGTRRQPIDLNGFIPATRQLMPAQEL